MADRPMIGGIADNPYAPPSAPLDTVAAPPPASSAAVPPSVIALLGQTRPWVKLLSILFFVAVGLGAVALLVASFGVFQTGPKSPLLMILPMGLVLLLYAAPSIHLWRYARAIARLQNDGGLTALEEALASQKSFWKYVGILAVVMLGLYALVFAANGAKFFGHGVGH